MRKLLATALLAAALPLVTGLSTGVSTGASASAAVPGTLTTSDGVLFQSCVRHPVSYAASPGSGNWSLFLTSTRSDGSAGPFASLSSGLGDQPTGVTTLDFCAGDGAGVYVPGRYTVSGALSWVDGGGVTHDEQLAPAAFTMAKPATRTTLTLSDRTPRPGQPISFRVKVTVQSPAGWTRVPDDALPLRLRVLARGPGEQRFSPLSGASGVYDYGGTWSRKFRWLGTLPRAQFEAETRGNKLLDDSVSKVVRLTTAGGR